MILSAVFPYIWPLAGPNIAKKGWPLLGKALERVWEGFGKFCAFWKGFARVLRMFCACFARVLGANFEMLVSGAPGARNQHLGA